MARLLIIEDEEQIARVVAAYLEKAGHESAHAPDGKRALELLEEDDFDLILLDLMLPDMKGEDLCRHIRSRSRVPLMMLTAKADEASLLYGFRVGADDYLTKPFSPRELMVRIEALLRRTRSEPAARLIDLDGGRILFDSTRRCVIKEGQDLHLTPLEFDILEILISYPGRIFSREDIIRTARGYDYDGLDRTVDSHIRNLRAKIEDNSKEPRLILTRRGKGFYYHGQ